MLNLNAGDRAGRRITLTYDGYLTYYGRRNGWAIRTARSEARAPVPAEPRL